MVRAFRHRSREQLRRIPEHRPAAPDEVGGRLKVASFNLLDYFTTIDTGAFICGPAGNLECRGADTAEEFTRQRDKIISALVGMSPDDAPLTEDNLPKVAEPKPEDAVRVCFSALVSIGNLTITYSRWPLQHPSQNHGFSCFHAHPEICWSFFLTTLRSAPNLGL